MRIKFCGLTRGEDVAAAVRLGVDYLGFNFHPASPRYVGARPPEELVSIVPAGVLKVGVFVDAPPDEVNAIAAAWSLDLLQLHGDEPPGSLRAYGRPVVKAIRVRDLASLSALAAYAPDYFLLDAHHPTLPGGTGRSFDWSLAEAAVRQAGRPVFLAGGLTPENVADAARRVHPFAVDVAGGIEEAPGKKSLDKMRRFVEALRGK